MIEVQARYETYGGWRAQVIWKYPSKNGNCFVVVHRPNCADQRIVHHDSGGKAIAVLGILEPPTYEKHHPADLNLDKGPTSWKDADE